MLLQAVILLHHKVRDLSMHKFSEDGLRDECLRDHIFHEAVTSSVWKDISLRASPRGRISSKMLTLFSSIALNAMKISCANMPGWSTCPNIIFSMHSVNLLIKWPLDNMSASFAVNVNYGFICTHSFNLMGTRRRDCIKVHFGLLALPGEILPECSWRE